MPVTQTAEDTRESILPPDLSEWTSDEARADFATQVAWYISDEIQLQCKEVWDFLKKHESMKIPFGERCYEIMKDHFQVLFGDKIDTALADNGGEYVDIIIGSSWDDCEVSGWNFEEAEAMEEKYHKSKKLMFRYF
jgi:hypothetical protein